MGYRSLKVTVKNRTGQKLVLKNYPLNHGKWSTKPVDINSAGECTWKAESKDGALIGVTGKISWESQETLGAFVISFDKPLGAGATKVDPSCPTGYKHELHGNTGGHHSSVTVIFSKI
ncbi:hypothetical protein ACFIJ5_09200 [Haloimpatiens sp. FM7330]|uniref:hypothetical protein n=1 Tax=Haloimpatiens sp. FM7330 TaxID=3298610 RepID=UPI00363E8F1D